LPETAEAPSIASALARASSTLATTSDTPRLDAELLLAFALGVDRVQLVLAARRELEPDVATRFEALVARRAAHEPVAYIVGRKEFRRITLSVDRRVLIPRPETELLVEVGLRLPCGARVLDVGTGSGAVALALADERPDLRVAGSDCSADALDLAHANGERLGLDVSWLQADLLDGLPDEFDAVLSNPPYVRDDERASLGPEIVRHEPASALFAGEDGLDVIRRLVGQAGERERVCLLAVEVGQGQAGAVGKLMRRAGFAAVRAERDLAGIERVVVGERGR
jgi:release factor glutamine methyltransferase